MTLTDVCLLTHSGIEPSSTERPEVAGSSRFAFRSRGGEENIRPERAVVRLA